MLIVVPYLKPVTFWVIIPVLGVCLIGIGKEMWFTHPYMFIDIYTDILIFSLLGEEWDRKSIVTNVGFQNIFFCWFEHMDFFLYNFISYAYYYVKHIGYNWLCMVKIVQPLMKQINDVIWLDIQHSVLVFEECMTFCRGNIHVYHYITATPEPLYWKGKSSFVISKKVIIITKTSVCENTLVIEH